MKMTFKRYLTIIALVIIAFFALAITDHILANQKYEQVYERIQEDYTLYINGIEVDSSKIDIYLYPYNKISFNDEKMAIYLAIYPD